MDDIRLGRAVRGVRIRRGLRQSDVAEVAGCSQDSVSRLERGAAGGMTVDRIRAIGAALEMLVEIRPRWHGSELDGLLGARHSAMNEEVSRRLRGLGWTTVGEVSFSIYGERGVIDILAWHAASRCLLVIELKTELVDVQEMLGTLDRKRRLARQVALERGWDPVIVAAWVILAESRTNRRRVAAHRTMLRGALPADGRAMNAWLLAPGRPIAALSFLSITDEARTGTRLSPVCRVRAARRSPNRGAKARTAVSQRPDAS